MGFADIFESLDYFFFRLGVTVKGMGSATKKLKFNQNGSVKWKAHIGIVNFPGGHFIHRQCSYGHGLQGRFAIIEQ